MAGAREIEKLSAGVDPLRYDWRRMRAPRRALGQDAVVGPPQPLLPLLPRAL